MSNEYVRNIRDVDQQESIALPAAGAAAYTPALDLGQTVGGEVEGIALEIAVPATPALVEAKVITITVQDSADNSSFAAIDPLISTTITGGTGGGAAAKSVRFRLPPTARRYVRAAFSIPADGGNNTAVEATLSLLA